MRSVTAERNQARTARAKAGRRDRAKLRQPAERASAGTKRSEHGGILTRAAGLAIRVMGLKRPVLRLTGLLLVFSVLAAVLAGGYVSKTFGSVVRNVDALVADAGFGISAIRLSGNSRTPPSAILAALGFEPGQSIFGADVQSARARLLALDWVSDAEVRRQYPDSIAVSIVEKLPFALWQTPNGLFVVERSGRIITHAQAADFPHLPLFVGDGAPQSGAELADAIALHRAVVARVRAMQRVSDRRWNLLLDDGVVVELPEVGWAKQLDVLEHLIVDEGVLERDITEIDLRSPDNLFFRLHNSDKQQPQRARGDAT